MLDNNKPGCNMPVALQLALFLSSGMELLWVTFDGWSVENVKIDSINAHHTTKQRRLNYRSLLCTCTCSYQPHSMQLDMDKVLHFWIEKSSAQHCQHRRKSL
jgi:hypothetical protein